MVYFSHLMLGKYCWNITIFSTPAQNIPVSVSQWSALFVSLIYCFSDQFIHQHSDILPNELSIPRGREKCAAKNQTKANIQLRKVDLKFDFQYYVCNVLKINEQSTTDRLKCDEVIDITKSY